jgi:hypothetical protein
MPTRSGTLAGEGGMGGKDGGKPYKIKRTIFDLDIAPTLN